VSDLSGWDFTDQSINGATIQAPTERAFTKEQLYSTASYKTRNLRGVILHANLSGANLRGQDLTGARLDELVEADLTDAVVAGAHLNFTKSQLYSTASYKSKNLRGIRFGVNDLTGWDFKGQDLTNVSFSYLTLTHADFTDAIIAGAGFSYSFPAGTGLTVQQLYSTASYHQKSLQRVGFSDHAFWGTDFSGQDLLSANFQNCYIANTTFEGANRANTSFRDAKLYNVNWNAADLRNLVDWPWPYGNYTTRNAIGSNGVIYGLDLVSGDFLVVRDYDGHDSRSWDIRGPLPIRIDSEMIVDAKASLQFLLDSDAWDSTISFQPGIPVSLGGELELAFAAGVDPATQIGRTFDLFDWTGVSPTGTFNVVSDYAWDTSQLYTSGEVTLIPEPTTLAILLAAALLALSSLSRLAGNRRSRNPPRAR
jgi:uncharacterized protein YjbI with pentapeptide repeats